MNHEDVGSLIIREEATYRSVVILQYDLDNKPQYIILRVALHDTEQAKLYTRMGIGTVILNTIYKVTSRDSPYQRIFFLSFTH